MEMMKKTTETETKKNCKQVHMYIRETSHHRDRMANIETSKWYVNV